MEVLGHGAYGCAFTPPLPCDAQTPTGRRYVGKVFSKEAAAYEERGAAHVLAHIDPRQELFLYPIADCRVDASVYQAANGTLRAMGDQYCPIDNPPRQMMQLVLPNGGTTLYTLMHMLPRRSLKRAQVLRLLGHVFAGIRVLSRNGLVHNDIKPGNIVISRDSGLRFIDWGLMTPASRVFDQHANSAFGVAYAPAPPEYRLPLFTPRYSSQDILDYEFDTMEVYAPLHPLEPFFTRYGLNNQKRADEYENLRRAGMPPAPGMPGAPDPSVFDGYALGYLLLCFAPLLVPDAEDDPRIVRIYERLVRGLMQVNPYLRMTIVQALRRWHDAMQIAGSDADLPVLPEVGSIDPSALGLPSPRPAPAPAPTPTPTPGPAPARSTNPKPPAPHRTPDLTLAPIQAPAPGPSHTPTPDPGPAPARSSKPKTPVLQTQTPPSMEDRLYKRFSQMSMRELKNTEAYKSLTPFRHGKSRMDKEALSKYLAKQMAIRSAM